ncbi:MAG: regulator of polyketide synthase expression, partial [Microbacterium sp.]|nr:regulator of polyketide synthase expression [Microbacterium sp.]
MRWVHSSDLADPTPFLSEGLVLLTTGTQFASDDDYAAYVGRLQARGVRALGFGTEVVRDGIPSGLTEACLAAGMPLFEVPYRTPFIAVARAGAEAIAADAYARRSWSLAAQRAVSLAALRPDGLSATLAELSRQLGCWVGLFDAAGALRTAHPAGSLAPAALDGVTAEVETLLRRGTRAASTLRAGDTAVSLQTLGRGGHLRGVLARSVVTAVVAMAALALEQQDGLGRAIGTFRAGLIQALGSDDPTLARRAARDLFGPLPTAPIVVALTPVASARSTAVSEWLEMQAHERRGELFFGRSDDGLVVVVPATARDLLDEIAERFETVVGCSAPTGYDGFSRGLTQARTARDRAATPGLADFTAPSRAPRSSRRSMPGSRTTARTRRRRRRSASTAIPCARASLRLSGWSIATCRRSPRAPSCGPRCGSRSKGPRLPAEEGASRPAEIVPDTPGSRHPGRRVGPELRRTAQDATGPTPGPPRPRRRPTSGPRPTEPSGGTHPRHAGVPASRTACRPRTPHDGTGCHGADAPNSAGRRAVSRRRERSARVAEVVGEDLEHAGAGEGGVVGARGGHGVDEGLGEHRVGD